VALRVRAPPSFLGDQERVAQLLGRRAGAGVAAQLARGRGAVFGATPLLCVDASQLQQLGRRSPQYLRRAGARLGGRRCRGFERLDLRYAAVEPGGLRAAPPARAAESASGHVSRLERTGGCGARPAGRSRAGRRGAYQRRRFRLENRGSGRWFGRSRLRLRSPAGAHDAGADFAAWTAPRPSLWRPRPARG
jgi:hypothetical protein